MQELQRRLTKKMESERPEPLEDKGKVLQRLLVGRGWEVLEAARGQYPQFMEKLEEALVRLVKEGRLAGPITGEEFYGFLKSLGLNVRLETRIRVFERGELKTLADKLRAA